MDIGQLVEDIKQSYELNAGADQIFTKIGISTISRIGSFILGILVIIIIILFPLIITLELIYIAFPIFRTNVDRITEFFSSKGADPRLASFAFRDAREAVTRANIDTIGGKSAFAIYIGIKVKSITFVFFIVALAVGGGAFLVRLLWNYIEPIITRIF